MLLGCSVGGELYFLFESLDLEFNGDFFFLLGVVCVLFNVKWPLFYKF